MWDSVDPRSADSRDREPTDPREGETLDPRDVFASGLELPSGLERERVHTHERDFDLRGSEVRTLATVGAFRVVPVDDLRDGRERPADLWHGDLDRLRTAGLIRTVAPLDRSDRERTTVVALTKAGRDLLEEHRTPDRESRQAFYADAIKPRELSHDAQLFRAYLPTAERLHSEGARIDRVVLDYELKREYQTFLNRPDRPPLVEAMAVCFDPDASAAECEAFQAMAGTLTQATLPSELFLLLRKRCTGWPL